MCGLWTEIPSVTKHAETFANPWEGQKIQFKIKIYLECNIYLFSLFECSPHPSYQSLSPD